MMKVLLLFTLLFSYTLADTQKAYLCGVAANVPTSVPSRPTFFGKDCSDYNFISFGDFYAVSGDVEGAAAIRNNLNLPNGQYSFGYQLRTAGSTAADEQLQYSLIVGGDANYPKGAIYPQGNGIPYAGAEQFGYVGGKLTTNANSGLQISSVGQGNRNSEFDTAQAYYTQLGQAYAAFPTTITAAYQYSGLTVTCPDNSASLWVVSVQASDMKKATYWTKTGCNDKAQFIFNVGFSAGVGLQFHGDLFPHASELVIWNVVGSQTVEVLIGVNGTLLAPNSVYNQPGTGVWIGLAIVGTAQQVLQINRVYCPAIPTPTPSPPTPTPAPKCSTWETDCAGLHFTPAGSTAAQTFVEYNAVVFGDFTANTGDVEGRLAASGSVSLGYGFSIGAQLSTINDMPDHSETYALIVGGDLTWGSGSLSPNTPGGVIEGAYVVGTATVESDLQTRVTKAADLTSTFAAAQTCYCGMSDTLNAMTPNTVHSIRWEGLFINCSSNTATEYVISVTASELNSITYYSLNNCNFQAQYVINVVGSDDVTIHGGSFPAPALAVVYNFGTTARTVNLIDTQLSGHFLGCRATLNQPTGVIVGKVVCGKVTMMNQINLQTTCVYPATVEVNMIAAANAAQGSFTVTVLNPSNFQKGDVTDVGTIVSVDDTTGVVTLNKPLQQSVSAGEQVGTCYISSTAGRGKQVQSTVDAGSDSMSSASAIGVAFAATIAALMA